tara:strand:- start:1246 stop:1995 length:750 start_codon:yes stop_codon:yes gene_type:complete
LKILVTNDDGIYSPGIYSLWKVAKEFGSVFVVAPDSQKSAVGHSITISKPLFIDKVTRENGFKGFSISGSPADCVKIGIKKILDMKPDLVLSGVNLGSNLGNNIIYSGTIAGAMEGAMQDIPSIAFSLDSFNPDSFKTSKIVIRKLIKLAIENKIFKKNVWNVNIPNCTVEELKGIKATNQGGQYFEDDFDSRKDPKGNKYFWMTGEMIDNDKNFKSDSFAVKNNYASITPIGYHLSKRSEIHKIEDIL